MTTVSSVVRPPIRPTHRVLSPIRRLSVPVVPRDRFDNRATFPSKSTSGDGDTRSFFTVQSRPTPDPDRETLFIVVLTSYLRHNQDIRGIHFIPASSSVWLPAIRFLQTVPVEFLVSHDVALSRRLLNDPTATILLKSVLSAPSLYTTALSGTLETEEEESSDAHDSDVDLDPEFDETGHDAVADDNFLLESLSSVSSLVPAHSSSLIESSVSHSPLPVPPQAPSSVTAPIASPAPAHSSSSVEPRDDRRLRWGLFRVRRNKMVFFAPR